MVSESNPADELIVEIGRVRDPETLVWLEGELGRWSECWKEWVAVQREGGRRLDRGLIDRIVCAVKERRAELEANRESGGES